MIPKLSRLVWVLLILLLASCDAADWAALSSISQDQDNALDEALLARGIELYRANYCGSCHTLSAANTRGTFGPSHDRAAEDAAAHLSLPSYGGQASSVAEYLRESIVQPTVFYTPGYEATNHHMPAFVNLAEADLDAIVYMLSQQPTLP